MSGKADGPVLAVENLKVIFPGTQGIVRAVEGVSLQVNRGECVAIVGESGCGKSVTSLAIMRLLDSPPALVQVDSIRLDGEEISALPESKMQDLRGRVVSLISQDALAALNPVMTVGRQIDEIFIRHQGKSKKEARAASIEALRLVGVPSPEKRYSEFPHELSGGMRQRVLIAMAFACHSRLIIADEPTTALDVTIQAQVLELLQSLQKAQQTALILITHDLSVVAHMADRVYVMYCGKVVEKAPLRPLFHEPLHPYTEALLQSVPHLSGKVRHYVQIPDTVPNPMNKPSGCYFHPRCRYCTAVCRESSPPMQTRSDGRQVRCFHPLDGREEAGAGRAPEREGT